MGVVTKGIGLSGNHDYTTLQSWADALPTNLVTDGNSQVALLYNEGVLGVQNNYSLKLAAITTSQTFNITIKCAPGHSWRDNPNVRTNPFRYDPSHGVAICGSPGYDYALRLDAVQWVYLDGLQVKGNDTGGSHNAVALNNNSFMKNCICYAFPQGGSVYHCVVQMGAGCSIYNNLLVIYGNSTGWCLRPGYATEYITNCTLAHHNDRIGAGVGTGASGIYYKNCAIFGFNAANTSTTQYSNYCATDLPNTPGMAAPTSSNNLINLPYAPQFVQPRMSWANELGSEDFRLQRSSVLRGKGQADLTLVPEGTDATGAARGSSWDIGAWQVIDSDYVVPPTPPDSKGLVIKTKVVRTKPPATPPKIDMTNPINRDISFAITAHGAQAVESVGSCIVTNYGLTPENNSIGQALRGGSGRYIKFDQLAVMPGRQTRAPSGVTYMIIGQVDGTYAWDGGIVACNGALVRIEPDNSIRFCDTNNAVLPFSSSTSNTVQAVGVHNPIIVALGDQTDPECRLYRNGQLIATVTTGTDGWYQGCPGAVWGDYQFPTTNMVNGTFNAMVGWKRRLSHGECLALSANPWQVFTPEYSLRPYPLSFPRKAFVVINGKFQQIPDNLVGTGLQPVVLYNGVMRVRQTTEGTPVVLIKGKLVPISPTDTLVI